MLTAAAAVGLPRRPSTTFTCAPFGLVPPQPSPIFPSRSSRSTSVYRVISVDERARRIGENEALFRYVNERIEGLNEAFGAITETMSVVCECGDLSCAEQIE